MKVYKYTIPDKLPHTKVTFTGFILSCLIGTHALLHTDNNVGDEMRLMNASEIKTLCLIIMKGVPSLLGRKCPDRAGRV